jgi:hypothetical protein
LDEMLHSVKAYQSKIILFAALKVFLEDRKMSVFIENKVEKVQGTPDEPDIITIGEGYTFIEEKGCLPSAPELLKIELDNIATYAVEHRFHGDRFKPQVVLLCPEEVYKNRKTDIQKFKSNLSVITYPFPVEDPIRFHLVQGIIADHRLDPLTDKTPVPHARTIMPTIKFLREEPPVPYSAWTIWQVIWDSAPMLKESFQVSYSEIMDGCRKFYPSWLSRDVDQITYSRLNISLELLRYVGWIEFLGKPDTKASVSVSYSKGDKIRSETLEFLSRRYLEFVRFKREPRKGMGIRRVRKPKASKNDTTLTDYV